MSGSCSLHQCYACPERQHWEPSAVRGHSPADMPCVALPCLANLPNKRPLVRLQQPPAANTAARVTQTQCGIAHGHTGLHRTGTTRTHPMRSGRRPRLALLSCKMRLALRDPHLRQAPPKWHSQPASAFQELTGAVAHPGLRRTPSHISIHRLIGHQILCINAGSKGPSPVGCLTGRPLQGGLLTDSRSISMV